MYSIILSIPFVAPQAQSILERSVCFVRLLRSKRQIGHSMRVYAVLPAPAYVKGDGFATAASLCASMV
jgi:hypothetical protein